MIGWVGMEGLNMFCEEHEVWEWRMKSYCRSDEKKKKKKSKKEKKEKKRDRKKKEKKQKEKDLYADSTEEVNIIITISI